MNVVFEIGVTADTPLEAAKIVQKMIQNQNCNWQYYIQNEDTQEIFSVDLDEDDENATILIDEYKPFTSL